MTTARIAGEIRHSSGCNMKPLRMDNVTEKERLERVMLCRMPNRSAELAVTSHAAKEVKPSSVNMFHVQSR